MATMRRTLMATRMSRWVLDQLTWMRGLTVASVHRRVTNLRVDDDTYVSLSAVELPLAPNGVAVGLDPRAALEDIGIRSGQSVAIRRISVDGGHAPTAFLCVDDSDLDVSLASAERWEPRPNLARVSRQALTAQLARSRALAIAEGDSRSWLPLLWARDGGDPALGAARGAAAGAAALCRAASDGDEAGVAAATRALAGLGPGLTPSGDDCLAGFAAAWGLVPQALAPDFRGREAVPRAVCAGARGRASALGWAGILHASRGEVSEPMGRFLAELADPAGRGLAPALRSVLSMGATSGGDWLTGALLGIDALLAQ